MCPCCAHTRRGSLGRAVKLLALGSEVGLLLGVLASRVLAFIAYQATPRDPLVLAGAVAAMSLLGLLAHGFQRNARCRSIRRCCCARSESV